MTEFWKSTKKWHCKYCDIHINDDAPSRQLHETGFRHIGNKERHLREIYKSGERKQKDADHEKKEIARMEKAAQAAYALDVASGAVPPSSSSATPSSSSSKPLPAAKPKTKYDSYTTAADLGFTDPDAVEEVPLDPKEEEEREQRKLEGRVGTWEVVAAPPPPPPAPESDLSYPNAEASGSTSRDRNRTGPGVRVVPKGDHDDDAAESRAFKFVRKDKRPLNWSMGHEDEGEIVVKVKEKEEGLMAKKRKLEDEERERERAEKEKLVWKPVVWGSRIGEGGEVGGESGVEGREGVEGGEEVEGGEVGLVVKEEETAVEEEKKVEVEVAAAPAAPLFKKRRGAPAGVGKKPKF